MPSRQRKQQDQGPTFTLKTSALTPTSSFKGGWQCFPVSPGLVVGARRECMAVGSQEAQPHPRRHHSWVPKTQAHLPFTLQPRTPPWLFQGGDRELEAGPCSSSCMCLAKEEGASTHMVLRHPRPSPLPRPRTLPSSLASGSPGLILNPGHGQYVPASHHPMVMSIPHLPAHSLWYLTPLCLGPAGTPGQ